MYSTIILAAAKAIGVPGALLLAICTQESSLVNLMVPDDNGAPSYGLCQLQEDTAKSMGYTGIATGPLKPSESHRDSRILKQMLDMRQNTLRNNWIVMIGIFAMPSRPIMLGHTLQVQNYPENLEITNM